jgi:ArsR family transcriptional regulator
MSLDTQLQTPAPQPALTEGCAALAMDEMVTQAQSAAAFLKALSHEGRLMILCHLQSGEKSVTELEHLLESRQAAVSQQLARLRAEGLVGCRREGKAIYYSIQDPKVATAIAMVYEMFCNPSA